MQMSTDNHITRLFGYPLKLFQRRSTNYKLCKNILRRLLIIQLKIKKMEETLTDCLVRVKEDLSQLKRVRDYLDKNAKTEERCSFSWRTIEAFNSILSVCTLQNTPETDALCTLLDSFHYLVRNNANTSALDNFGFELGIICVKVLSAIERTDFFEVLFSKLLSIVTVVCKHNSGIWKAVARQILNILINKKFSVNYLEGILKSYICMIRNVESFVLHEFSCQNLGLLKTISLLVQKLGDFELQSDIMEVIFLHLSKDTKLMDDFFTTTDKQFFQSLRFSDFEEDCRLFLNAVNKSRKESERKVYSVRCQVLYLGGCFVEPPLGRSYIWVDANKDTERLSIKYGYGPSNENRVIHVLFSELINVHLENDQTGGSRYLIIQTKSLKGRLEGLRNDNISLAAESADGVSEFVNFLKAVIREKEKKAHGVKASKTVDCLFINIGNSKEIQDNAITSSNKPGVDHIFPNVFSPYEKVSRPTLDLQMQQKPAQSLKGISDQAGSPTRRAFQTQFTVLLSPKLSANSFAESLSKHLGSDIPEPKHNFEDSVRTVEFLQKGTPEKNHRLFRSPDKIFNVSQANEHENFTFIFEENKENISLAAAVHQGTKIWKPKLQNTPMDNHEIVSLGARTDRGLKTKRNSDMNLPNTQSQDCFQGNSNVSRKKKPRLPKFKRTKKAVAKEFTNEDVGKNDLGLRERTKSKGFPQSKAAEEQNTDSRKTQPKSWKLEIRGFAKKQNKFENKVELKQGKSCVQGNHKRPGRGEGKETREIKTSSQKVEVLLRKESNLRHSETEGQKKESGSESPPRQSNMKSGEEKTKSLQSEAGAKPSLLDPNGYAFKRWCRPTTSERSNFWLKKLKASEKSKTDVNIFEFSEDFDSVCGKSTKKIKPVHSRQSFKLVEKKPTSLQQAREFLKKAQQKRVAKSSMPRKGSSEEGPESPSSSPHTGEFAKSEVPFFSECSPVGSQEKDAEDKDTEHEFFSNEDEDSAIQGKKRGNEDGPSAGTYIKKKPKTALPRKIFFSILRRRLQAAEERDKRQTDQIIQIVNEAVDRLVDRLQAKDEEKTTSYLKTAEAASDVTDSEILALSLRAKRIQRAIVYFEAGCSVTDSCRALDEHISRARDSLKASTGTRSTSEALNRIGSRLKDLIRAEAERTIENEWTARRDLLSKCVYFGD